mmetsp:Transcript_24079/g.55611  ORF Transcript_24079/g.55611 Transcript_24079/m.55611 type:complete len:229 (-) Transcript_24079:366-1052(-)
MHPITSKRKKHEHLAFLGMNHLERLLRRRPPSPPRPRERERLRRALSRSRSRSRPLSLPRPSRDFDLPCSGRLRSRSPSLEDFPSASRSWPLNSLIHSRILTYAMCTFPVKCALNRAWFFWASASNRVPQISQTSSSRTFTSQVCCSSISFILALISSASVTLNFEPSMSPLSAACSAAAINLFRSLVSWSRFSFTSGGSSVAFLSVSEVAFCTFCLSRDTQASASRT